MSQNNPPRRSLGAEIMTSEVRAWLRATNDDAVMPDQVQNELVKRLQRLHREFTEDLGWLLRDLDLRRQGNQAAAAAFQPATGAAPGDSEGWKEAAIAWTVCASIHTKWAKGKDALFSTRQADFVKHANHARSMLGLIPDCPPTTYPVEGLTGAFTKAVAEATEAEPAEDAPGGPGLRFDLGRAITEALGNPGDDGTVHLDPFDSDDIDGLVDAVLDVIRKRLG